MILTISFTAGLLLATPLTTDSQQEAARALVQRVVNGELAADARDHSHWMFRDVNEVSGKSTVRLVVQTAEGDISKTLEIDGHALTEPEQKEDAEHMRQFVTDPSLREKQKRNQQEDGAKAEALTKMLPDAFLWRELTRRGKERSLAFRPNPNFSPPTREDQVFAAMEGTMVVDTKQNRIVSLRGRLTKNVDFGFGLLGQLQKGGSFDVQRKEIARGVWEITATHVHIQGHALIFKSISEQQDEETSNYKPAPRNITLAAAAKMLNDGTVAKKIGLTQKTARRAKVSSLPATAFFDALHLRGSRT